MNATPDDLVKTLDALTTGTHLSTQANRVLPPAPAVPAIPARSGTASADLVLNGSA